MYCEIKRCMLASLRLAADFSRGCAGRRIGNLLFATHPHHVAVREWFYASSVSGGSRHSESVFIAPIYCTGHKPQGVEMRVLRPDRGEAMQGSGCELRRIHPLGTSVNKGNKKDRRR